MNRTNRLLSMTAALECIGGVSYKVRINFVKNNFIVWEWRNKELQLPFPRLSPDKIGDIDEFKRAIYSLNIWDWEPVYQKGSGIILADKYWYTELVTKDRVYHSEGSACFPPNWDRFCQALECLTGTPFR